MGALWHLILSDGYARLAKTAVEEGVELVTYSMWLAAAVEYFVRQRASVAQASSVEHVALERAALARR